MRNSIKSKRTKTSQRQTKRYSYKRNQKRNQKKGIKKRNQKRNRRNKTKRIKTIYGTIGKNESLNSRKENITH